MAIIKEVFVYSPSLEEVAKKAYQLHVQGMSAVDAVQESMKGATVQLFPGFDLMPLSDIYPLSSIKAHFGH